MAKKELPVFFEKVEYNKSGNLILTNEQEEYARQEVERCKKGAWIYIKGIPKYLTGKYYFFLQYYILEDGNNPEFREADRIYFLFHEHWHKVQWCLGNIRTKNVEMVQVLNLVQIFCMKLFFIKTQIVD